MPSFDRSPKDDITLRDVRSRRRRLAATLKNCLKDMERMKVTKLRTPELEMEKEIILMAYQALMKPGLLSPSDMKRKEDYNKSLEISSYDNAVFN